MDTAEAHIKSLYATILATCTHNLRAIRQILLFSGIYLNPNPG